jgi:hypothetical protein
MHVQSLAYAVLDTRMALGADSPEFFAMVDTSGRANARIPEKQRTTLLKNDIGVMTWAHRAEHVSKFSPVR